MEDLHLALNFHSFQSVSCFHFSPLSHLLFQGILYCGSLTQCCVVHPPHPPAITSLFPFSLYNVVCPLSKLLCFTLCFSPNMYASPLASFTLYIYNAVYECPFVCTDFRLPLLHCMGLILSIYIYNAVYVLLPIMLSISVFLLLAGWKGVRGGLSQLIYHIKYQPSSTFFLPLFLIPLSLSSLTFSLTSFFSPPTIYISPSHLCLHFFYLTPPFPVHSLSHSLTHSPSEPSSSFLKVPISLTIF